MRIIFTSFKIGSFFSTKDPSPKALISNCVYKFCCAGCNASYIGETQRHLTVRVKEHLVTDKHSHIYKHFNENPICKQLSAESNFSVIDRAQTPFSLKIKEAIHIKFNNPQLNKQIKHVNLTIL